MASQEVKRSCWIYRMGTPLYGGKRNIYIYNTYIYIYLCVCVCVCREATDNIEELWLTLGVMCVWRWGDVTFVWCTGWLACNNGLCAGSEEKASLISLPLLSQNFTLATMQCRCSCATSTDYQECTGVPTQSLHRKRTSELHRSLLLFLCSKAQKSSRTNTEAWLQFFLPVDSRFGLYTSPLRLRDSSVDMLW